MTICDFAGKKETLGKDYLLFIDTNETVGSHTWVLVGGQRSATFSMSREEVDTSDKTSGGWGSQQAGMGSWSIESEGIEVLNNIGKDYLETQFLDAKPVSIMLRHIDGKAYKGCASITEYSLEAPHDDAASNSVTFNGIGAPIIEDNEPDPLNPTP